MDRTLVCLSIKAMSEIITEQTMLREVRNESGIDCFSRSWISLFLDIRWQHLHKYAKAVCAGIKDP